MKKDQSNKRHSDQKKKKLIIAIDGNSSCGKSTLAKDLATELDYIFIDSGAMYRAVSLLFLQKDLEVKESTDYSDLLSNHGQIHFEIINGKNSTFLNNTNVESEIRSQKVADIVSQVATNSSIRHYLVKRQRTLNKGEGVVMDGRDIGTVVFPNADFKFFVVADVDIRAKRRHTELALMGTHLSIEEVKSNLLSRDHIDSTRKDSPLRMAEDAILIDTSHLTREGQLKVTMEYLLSSLK